MSTTDQETIDRDKVIVDQTTDLLRASTQLQALKTKSVILSGFVRDFLRSFEMHWESRPYTLQEMQNYVTAAKYMARLDNDQNIATEVERVMRDTYGETE